MSRGRVSNPIYQHLTRHAHWPSERGALILWILFTVIGSAVVCGVPLLTGPRSSVPVTASDLFPARVLYALLAGSLMFVFLGPLITAVITGIATADAAEPKMLDLIRITDIPHSEIVSGFLFAALFRLRWLWIAGYGMLLPVSIALLNPFSDRPHPITGMYYSVADLFPGSLVVFTLAFAGLCLSAGTQWMTICASLWAGLKFRQIAPAAALSFGMGIVSIIGMLLWLGITLYAVLVAGSVFDIYGAAGIVVINSLASVWFFYEVGKHFLNQIKFEHRPED